MAHPDYLSHLRAFFAAHADDPLVDQAATAYARELIILSTLDLEPARAFLDTLYSPIKRRTPRDPVCLLRLLLLMLLRHVSGITEWIRQLRGSPLLAAMTGFEPDAIPGVGTCYAFLDRLVNGPYQPRCPHVSRPADADKHRTIRRLHDQTDDRHAYPDLYDSQSEALAAELQAHAEEPRRPTLHTRMDDLFVTLGLLPSLEAGLFGTLDQLADAAESLALEVSGDGSPLESAASPHGAPVCDCPPDARQHGTCAHPRAYTSATAQWSRCVGRRTRYVFGDRYYHLTAHVNGRDLPLLSCMGQGNEADATLSLTAMDHLLKLIREHRLPLTVGTFAGDMHHDTYAHADWYAAHGILTAIPCRTTTETKAQLTEDGPPRCPAGTPMRHHQYDATKHTHVYACPAKRLTHRQGNAVYVFHPEDCPAGAECQPDSPLGPFAYRKPDDDRRLYPPIPRNSKRFTTLYNQRTTTERLNALHDRYLLDRRARSAAYGLIYLTLAMICEHAVVRSLVTLDHADSQAALLKTTLADLRQGG